MSRFFKLASIILWGCIRALVLIHNSVVNNLLNLNNVVCKLYTVLGGIKILCAGVMCYTEFIGLISQQ